MVQVFYLSHPQARKINSPYSGTLSSYGYVLLVIYFLVHVKNPPVLPNLQQMPPLRAISHVCSLLLDSLCVAKGTPGGYAYRGAQYMVCIHWRVLKYC